MKIFEGKAKDRMGDMVKFGIGVIVKSGCVVIVAMEMNRERSIEAVVSPAEARRLAQRLMSAADLIAPKPE